MTLEELKEAHLAAMKAKKEIIEKGKKDRIAAK